MTGTPFGKSATADVASFNVNQFAFPTIDPARLPNAGRRAAGGIKQHEGLQSGG